MTGVSFNLLLWIWRISGFGLYLVTVFSDMGQGYHGDDVGGHGAQGDSLLEDTPKNTLETKKIADGRYFRRNEGLYLPISITVGYSASLYHENSLRVCCRDP